MKFELLARKVLSIPKASFTSMTWGKELKVKAAYKSTYKVEKKSTGIVRFGVQYDNMSNVIKGRENGTLSGVNQGLTWGNWIDGFYPYFIEHKGNKYVRCALVNGNKIKSEYFINGKSATRQEAENICLKSEFSSGAEVNVLTIKADNIISIN